MRQHEIITKPIPLTVQSLESGVLCKEEAVYFVSNTGRISFDLFFITAFEVSKT